MYDFDHHLSAIPQGVTLNPSLITMSDKPVYPKDGTSGAHISMISDPGNHNFMPETMNY